MLVAVVAPHQDNTESWAETNGHKGSFNDLCALEELKKYILQQLKAVAEKNKVCCFLLVKAILCLASSHENSILVFYFCKSLGSMFSFKFMTCSLIG